MVHVVLLATFVFSSICCGAALTVSDEGLARFLAVTGYWKLTNSDADSGNLRSGPGGYLRNMKFSCTLNTPMIFYGDAFGVESMIRARGGATPPLVEAAQVNYSSFAPCATHGEMMRSNPGFWVHAQDAPSISLGCVWDGKVSLLARAAREHPDYDHYAWVDVGMHASGKYKEIFQGHNQQPWPHPSKLAQLPSNKISVSHSGVNCDKMQDRPWQFWHCVAATAFVIPRSIIFEVEQLFYGKLEECIQFWQHKERIYLEREGGYYGGYGCLSEQMIMSVMARERPDLFHWVGNGWGRIAANLTTDATNFAELAYGGSSDLFGWLGSPDHGETAKPRRLATTSASRRHA